MAGPQSPLPRLTVGGRQVLVDLAYLGLERGGVRCLAPQPRVMGVTDEALQLGKGVLDQGILAGRDTFDCDEPLPVAIAAGELLCVRLICTG